MSQREVRLPPESVAERFIAWAVLAAAALYIAGQAVRALGWWSW